MVSVFPSFMKVVSSIKSAKKRHPACQVVRRKGKIYVDYLRNARGASAIASYSLRARPNFPVATPIEWRELRKLSGGDAFDRLSVVRRLETLAADPWDELVSSSSELTAKMRRDVGMKR